MSATEKRAAGTVSERDKERMRRFAESCKQAETDELVDGEALESLVASANRARAARGIPPLDACNKDWDNPSDLGFHRRAESLGLVRRSR